MEPRLKGHFTRDNTDIPSVSAVNNVGMTADADIACWQPTLCAVVYDGRQSRPSWWSDSRQRISNKREYLFIVTCFYFCHCM